MKYLNIVLIIIFILCCASDCGESMNYKYTVKNDSGKDIKIKAYMSGNPAITPIITNIAQEGTISKTYEDGLPPRGYNYGYFFGNNTTYQDSLVVIYANEKKMFYTENCSDVRNPLNYCEYGDAEEIFIFTLEDYNNAIDCGGACE